MSSRRMCLARSPSRSGCCRICARHGVGRIVTISSVGGRIATFGLAAYCATKFAQEAFGEALALEVAPFGLQSILIEPGMIRTSRWSTNRGNSRGAQDPKSAYYDMFKRHETIADRRVEQSKTQPLDVAMTVHEALTAANPRLQAYIVGRNGMAACWHCATTLPAKRAVRADGISVRCCEVLRAILSNREPST